MALALLGTLALWIGCGGGGSDGSAQDTAQAYVSARNQGDATSVCDLYDDQLREGSGGIGLLPSGTQAKGDCEAFVRKQISSDKNRATLKVVRIDESGDQATAVLTAAANGKTSRTSIPLKREDGEWKVSGVPFFGSY